MKMSLDVLLIGSLAVFAAVVSVVVILPGMTITDKPSDIYRPRTDLENSERKIFIANGCTYCHSMAVRNLDWTADALRIAQAGDYIDDQPHLLGSERTGPDLQLEGGLHPDDWHVAHFFNPRHTRPDSIMPQFAFLAPNELRALVAFAQSLGLKLADERTRRQRAWRQQSIAAFEAGTDANVQWVTEHVPAGWRALPNPYPTTPEGLARGRRTYDSFCVGCHSEVGDGMGPAAVRLNPPPLNFTTLREREISGGILYYQIMNGITGTAMPFFKHELESEKIWEVGNYVAVTFIGKSDAGQNTGAIPAAFELQRNEATP